jgi:predicted CopG family antitoxin
MHRTQIYLDDNIYDYLEKEKARTRLAFSEIIRNNIRSNMGKSSSAILEKMHKAIGSLKKSELSPEETVRRLRKDRTV